MSDEQITPSYAGPCPRCRTTITMLRWLDGWRAYHVAADASVCFHEVTRAEAHFLLEGHVQKPQKEKKP